MIILTIIANFGLLVSDYQYPDCCCKLSTTLTDRVPSRPCRKIEPIQLMGQNTKASRIHDAQATWDLDMFRASDLRFHLDSGQQVNQLGLFLLRKLEVTQPQVATAPIHSKPS